MVRQLGVKNKKKTTTTHPVEGFTPAEGCCARPTGAMPGAPGAALTFPPGLGPGAPTTGPSPARGAGRAFPPFATVYFSTRDLEEKKSEM